MEEIPAAELVPGDLIALERGLRSPADARLVRAALRAQAALTGESAAVEKDAGLLLRADTPLADRRSMVYLGTAVLAGSGLAVVTATGLATELGRIGQLVALAGERETPLERQVEQLGRRLMALGLPCAVWWAWPASFTASQWGSCWRRQSAWRWRRSRRGCRR